MRFILTIFVIASVLAMSHGDDEPIGCTSEIEKVPMTLQLKGDWEEELEDPKSNASTLNEVYVSQDIEAALPSAGVCNVTVKKYYPSMHADAVVYFVSVSYKEEDLTYGRVKTKINEYANNSETQIIQSVSSLICDSEVKKVPMTLQLKGDWDKALDDPTSDEFISNQSRLQLDIENAASPLEVCNVTVERFYEPMYADAMVYFISDSYEQNNMTNGRLKKTIEDYASTHDDTIIDSVSSVTCDSEVKNVRMMARLRWDWKKTLKKSDSEYFEQKQDELRQIVENATSPLEVCNVIVKKFHPGVYADTLVLFASDSYNEKKMSYNKLQKKMNAYAKSERDTYLLSVSGVTSNGQVPTILGATFMCTVFEMVWRLL